MKPYPYYYNRFPVEIKNGEYSLYQDGIKFAGGKLKCYF